MNNNLQDTNYENSGNAIKCTKCNYRSNMEGTACKDGCKNCGHRVKVDGYPVMKYNGVVTGYGGNAYSDLGSKVDADIIDDLRSDYMKVYDADTTCDMDDMDHTNDEDMTKKFNGTAWGTSMGTIFYIVLVLFLLWLAKERGQLTTAKGNTNIPVIVGIIIFAPIYVMYILTDGFINVTKNNFDNLIGK